MRHGAAPALDTGIGRIIRHRMKTVVAIPDPVFKSGERLRPRLCVSRSKLYDLALQETIERQADREIARRLDAACLPRGEGSA